MIKFPKSLKRVFGCRIIDGPSVKPDSVPTFNLQESLTKLSKLTGHEVCLFTQTNVTLDDNSTQEVWYRLGVWVIPPGKEQTSGRPIGIEGPDLPGMFAELFRICEDVKKKMSQAPVVQEEPPKETV